MKVRRAAKQLAIAIVAYASVDLHVGASGNSIGTVTSIFPNATGQVFITTTSAASQPACAIYGWVIDLNGSAAAGGRAMLATIMWAQAMGKSVYIVGKGTCDVWGDRETIGGVVAN